MSIFDAKEFFEGLRVGFSIKFHLAFLDDLHRGAVFIIIHVQHYTARETNLEACFLNPPLDIEPVLECMVLDDSDRSRYRHFG